MTGDSLRRKQRLAAADVKGSTQFITLAIISTPENVFVSAQKGKTVIENNVNR